MSTETVFKPERFYLLIRNAVLLNRSAILLVSGALAGILLFLSAIDAFAVCREGLHQRLFLATLYLGGLIVTGRVFRELHDKVKGPVWLLIPASTLEKVASRIALSTILYVAGAMILYLVFSMISEVFNWILFSRHHALFKPFEAGVLKGAALYVALQAPFLVGAVYFRRHALSKTVLVLLGYSFVLFLVILLGSWLIFGGLFHDMISGLETYSSHPFFDSDTLWAGALGMGRVGLWVWRIFFWAVMPLTCWIVCYFRLKEAER